MKSDIEDITDIHTLVDQFYTRVREDQLLGPVFENVIQDRWPEHLDKMYRFWGTVLLDEHSYQGSPFLPHAKLPIEKSHFERWLQLFRETLKENFIGPRTDEALWRADNMAKMFHHKIRHYRQNPSRQPL